jgi:disulfide bond formation protein DsbB
MAGHPRRLLVLLMVLAVAGALLGSATAALAHVRPAPTPAVAPDPIPAAPPSVAPAPAVDLAVSTTGIAAPTPWPPAVLGVTLIFALLLAATLVAPRRVLIAALVLVLAIIAVEESVHSVHHLADQRAAANCAVAAASVHVQGATEPVPVPVVGDPTPVGAVATSEPDHPGSRSLRPDEGRAPPSA